jgi:hypothetical protein
MISVAALDEPRLLFSNQNSLDHTRALLETAIRDVDGIPADELLNTPTEDIVAELVEKHGFTPPTRPIRRSNWWRARSLSGYSRQTG